MLIKAGSKCERKSQVDDINVYPTPVRVGSTSSWVLWYERWKNKATITYKLFLISHHGKVISKAFLFKIQGRKSMHSLIGAFQHNSSYNTSKYIGKQKPLNNESNFQPKDGGTILPDIKHSMNA